LYLIILLQTHIEGLLRKLSAGSPDNTVSG